VGPSCWPDGTLWGGVDTAGGPSAGRRDCVSLGAGLARGAARDAGAGNELLASTGGVRVKGAEVRPDNALVPLGGVREGKPELRTGNDGDALDAVSSVANASVLPHGLRISRGAEVATDGVAVLGWKPDMRVLALACEGGVVRFAFEDACAVSAMIALRSTLNWFCVSDENVFTKT